jgi:TonB family protein
VRKNEKLISISEQIPLEKPMELVQEMVSKPLEEKNVVKETSATVSVKGQPDERWKDFYRFVGRFVKYPVEAQSSNFQGNTQIKFTLKNGRVNSISSNVDLGYGCDEEVMKVILSYKEFKQVADGKYALKVSFKLMGVEDGYKNDKVSDVKGYQNLSGITIMGYASSKQELRVDDVYDFVSIDKQPEYPGGIKKFYEYLGTSIRYPKKAKADNIQGKVFASFVVEKDGKLTDIKITRGVSSDLDEEAIRVLESCPSWNPGIMNGAPVRVKYNINVNFALNNEGNKPKESEPGKKSENLNDPTGRIKIRGNNETFKGLYVLDGEIVDNDIMKTLNTNAIESISVLKDHSATSLYGPRGKDGVIIVKTKAGKKDNSISIEGKPTLQSLELSKKF